MRKVDVVITKNGAVARCPRCGTTITAPFGKNGKLKVKPEGVEPRCEHYKGLGIVEGSPWAIKAYFK